MYLYWFSRRLNADQVKSNRTENIYCSCVFLSALVSLSSSNKPTQIELAVDQQLANASDGKVNLSLIVLIYDVSEPRVLQMVNSILLRFVVVVVVV